ncbi:MAG TPA: low affinity iron permease family protein [Phycisphaerae bacterium]|nr:low affinity iron permease family protein [Phycisphaerae bacterium]
MTTPAHPAPAPSFRLRELFRRIATWAAGAMGSPWSFIASIGLIVVWAAAGPMCHFSDTWQLVINTTTTIITFLMVFLIQNSQNRDGKAIQLKLDELIRSVKGARNRLVELEDCTDEELAQLKEEFAKIRERATGPRQKAAAEEVAHLEAEQHHRTAGA